jgi:hypothetical protein
MRLEHAEESVKEFYEKNPEVPAIMTWGQVWRGGGATVMEIRKYETTSATHAFHATIYASYHMTFAISNSLP